MRKIISLLITLVCGVLLFNSVSFACDFCLLSQGISPLDTLKGAGIRINERYSVLDKVYTGTVKIENPGAKEEYRTTEFTGFYSVSEDVMLLAVVPVRKTRMNGELIVNADGTVDADSAMKGGEVGLGDVALLGRYTFFKKHAIDATTSAAGLLGVKFPTGKTNGKTDDGMEFLDSHLQLGTGSADFLLGLSFSHSVQRLSLSANLLGTITTEGKFGDTKHQFGNSLNYDLTAKYRFYPGEPSSAPQLFLSLGVNGELRGREKTEGVEDPNSGGHTIYLSPGIQVIIMPHWIVELSYQQAIYHNLYGIQGGESYKVNTGVTYLF